MTTREFYQAITEADLNPEMTAKAMELIQAMDARNEKRKSTESKEKKEAAARRQSVLDFLQKHPGETFTRDAVAEALTFTPGQVTAACKTLLEAEAIIKAEAKIDKSRKVVYSIA